MVPKGEEVEYSLFMGRPRKRRIKELEQKHGKFELTMNSYLPVISRSTMACNSNVQYVADGVPAFYLTKYTKTLRKKM